MRSEGSTPPPDDADRTPRRWTSWLPVGIFLLGVLEIVLLVLLAVKTSVGWAALVVAVGWVAGMALLVAAGQQSFVRMRSMFRAVRGTGDVQSHLSRPAFTMLAAACFFFPGLITDLIGLVLLVTPVQRKVVTSLGVGGGSEKANRVLYHHSDGDVIDGEIVITPETTGPGGTGHGTNGSAGPDTTPPTITQGPPTR
jgi:UPF0716 protein FxsA